jgi:hypothetical protein
MKKINVFLILLFLVATNCYKSKTKIDEKWRQKRFEDYYLKIPPGYELYFFSKDSINGVISNGAIIDGAVSNGNMKIELNGGYGVPTVYDEGGKNLKSKIIGSVKEKMLAYPSGINKGLILISVWDTLKSTDLFNSRGRYRGIVLTVKNINSKQKDMVLRIFDSVRPISKDKKVKKQTI